MLMESTPTCPYCGAPMWLVTQHTAHSYYECFHCPDEPRDPEQQQRGPGGLRNAFCRMKHLWWQTRNRPLCDGQHIGQDSVVRKYSFSTQRPGEGARTLKAAGPMPDATRQYSFVYCVCGHPNAVQNAKADDKISFFCKGCRHSLDSQSGDVRRGSVTVPLLSLRD
jgi:hypothetical protein